MQVVLKQRVPKLGNEHDVVNVRPGFARNFLLPNNLAALATKGELKKAELLKLTTTAKLVAVIENAKEIATKLKDTVLAFKRKARGDKLYGSVKEADIVDALNEQAKLEINKDMVKLAEPLKDLGEHKVKVQLTEDVTAEFKVLIEAE